MNEHFTPREIELLLKKYGPEILPTLLPVKPNRETIINSDDITNLRIALETATSLDAFLRMI